MTRGDLLKKFRIKAKAIATAKRKTRFLHVVGKLKVAKLLDAPNIQEYGGPVELEDALWAGTIEPRILEVLPVLIVTRPKYLRIYNMPDDLKRVVDDIHAGKAQRDFRGIPCKDYCQWLPIGKLEVSRLKTFRMRPEELRCLETLRIVLGVRSDAEVLRQALRSLERSLMASRA